MSNQANNISTFKPGQRWVSHAELELGLGTVVAVEFRTINMVFLGSGETRTYATDSAPLTRLVFSAGDRARSHEGWELTIDTVQEHDGLLTYHGHQDDGTSAALEEGQLDNFIRLDRPKDRLMTLQIDKNEWFELRLLTHHHIKRLMRSRLRGLCGGRTSLMAHQLYISHEVASRYAPRVLLADEVGLGKTIEAGMIIHHQLLTEHAKRVLIVVPENLLHQWLVEMLRRFNLFFSLFDEQRCQAAEESTSQTNPFHTEQLVLCSLDFLLLHPQRFQQALDGEWDMLVVDEAHHLQWSEDNPSQEYQFIEKLATVTRSVLLLTATPEQLGKQSHFARLRLLDPDRFPDYQSYLQEEKSYEPVAHAVERLLQQQPLDEDSLQTLRSTLAEGDNAVLLDTLLADSASDAAVQEARHELVEHLLDRHGTGRVLFRNTRAAIKGFPGRCLSAYPLPLPETYATCLSELQQTGITDISELLCPELPYQASVHYSKDWTDIDPRVTWLQEKLLSLRPEKVLVITAHAETALDLMQSLRIRSGIDAAVFHEGLSIVERDRAAAFFADSEYGSQVLICSEIGSEGRNFQFAHHLILFDLPSIPDLLEQRIGRLDRIGQSENIQIHVPYLQQSAQEVMFHWYHHGLNAFEQTCPVGQSVYSQLKETLIDALHQIDDSLTDLHELTETTRVLTEQLLEALQQGRNRLLEYNSCRPHEAERIQGQAVYEDRHADLTGFLDACFDSFGVEFEEHSQQCFIIKPGDHMQVESFPGIPEEGMTITCDRDTALSNEDIHFITWEHPVTRTACDMIVNSELGNTAVCALKHPSLPPGQLLLECIFLLETSIDRELQSRQAVISPMVRTLINQQGKDVSPIIAEDYIRQSRQAIPVATASRIITGFGDALKNLLSHSEKQALPRAQQLLSEAMQERILRLQHEASRLTALQQINSHVRAEEIEFFRDQAVALKRVQQSAKLRVDALRVIVTV